MDGAHILIVEDDAVTAEEIRHALAVRGFRTTLAADGEAALAAAGPFDLVTLDRMLPRLDGLSVVERLRERGTATPVLMVSALSDVDERVAGLRAGGDDYLVKPFALAELVARVEVLLRRARPGSGEAALSAGPLRIDLLSREVTVAGAPVPLLAMEYKLLEFLARHAGQVVGRQLLFERVWGYFFDPGANLIAVHIARLRRKLDRPGEPSLIETVKGEGYRLVAG